MTLEMPAHLEKTLIELREEHAAELSAKPILVDLESLPAISSRQLGILLAGVGKETAHDPVEAVHLPDDDLHHGGLLLGHLS